jgi:hypothetical protein
VLLGLGLCSQIVAQPVAAIGLAETHAATISLAFTSDIEGGRVTAAQRAVASAGQLIVIGFMGGNVSGGNLVHREALVARDLQKLYPLDLQAAVFANSDWKKALQTLLLHLDAKGAPSEEEKHGARIILYGHSWGASEAVTMARRLQQLGIPVLLTIQIDSVEKLNENDGSIPPNVREAVNFYQSEGLLHGRSSITAMDPKQTTILGNYEMSYREHPIACDGFPWFARAFMKPHIEIENDPAVWERIVALIRTQLP